MPATPPTKVASAPKAATKDDDDFEDMFAADEEDENGETEADRQRHARMEAARKLKEEKDAKDGKVKKEKAKVEEKSLLVLEVKPWEGMMFDSVVVRMKLTHVFSGYRFGCSLERDSAI